MIKFGICSWCIPGEGSKNIQTASQMGYEGIILDLGKVSDGYELSSKAVQKKLISDQMKHAVAFPTVAVNDLCRTGMSQAKSYKEIQKILDLAVDCADALGAHLLQLPSFGQGLIKNEAELVNTGRCLKYACQLANQKQLFVGTENALDSKQNKHLLEIVDEPNLKIYFDSANPLYLAGGLDAAQLLRDLRDSICEIHVKDVDRDFETAAFHFVPLGTGLTDFKICMEILRSTNYDGWIHVENDLNIDQLIKDRSLLQKIFT